MMIVILEISPGESTNQAYQSVKKRLDAYCKDQNWRVNSIFRAYKPTNPEFVSFSRSNKGYAKDVAFINQSANGNFKTHKTAKEAFKYDLVGKLYVREVKDYEY